MSDDLEMVPGRGFWDRSYPVVSIPKKLHAYYLRLKSKFGREIADLILAVYKADGERVALLIANKMLTFNNTPELLSYLSKQVKKLRGIERTQLIDLIYRYQYGYYFQELLNRLEENSCEEARDLAISIFHSLASKGLFFPTSCIINAANHEICGENLLPSCRRTLSEYKSTVSQP